MKAFFTNHEGKFDSSLFFRFIWHVILIGAWIYYAFFDEPPRIDPLAHLGFAAGMALGEGAAYNWRRGQDKKQGAQGASLEAFVPDSDEGA